MNERPPRRYLNHTEFTAAVNDLRVELARTRPAQPEAQLHLNSEGYLFHELRDVPAEGTLARYPTAHLLTAPLTEQQLHNAFITYRNRTQETEAYVVSGNPAELASISARLVGIVDAPRLHFIAPHELPEQLPPYAAVYVSSIPEDQTGHLRGLKAEGRTVAHAYDLLRRLNAL